MIFWIKNEYKNEYLGSAKASGLRYKFYNYDNEFDQNTVLQIKEFIKFLRRNYYFPIRINILFCNTSHFNHIIDNHLYYGVFYGMDDEKRKCYPRISVAAKISNHHTIEDILYILAHEITHYYQWYFLEEDKRTDKSLEIETNKWAKYILELYFNNLN